MNILVINHYAGSQIHGMEYRPYYFAREWVRMGHKVTIVAASFSHLRTKQISLSDNIKTEDIDGINYCWIKTPAYHGNTWKRICNMLVFLFRLSLTYRQIADRSSPDVVIASSTYPLDIFPAKLMAKRHNAKLIYEVHDLWPLTPKYLSGMSKWHPYIMLLQVAEDYACRNAKKVVSLLPYTSQYLQTRGMDNHKFIYIPNGIVIDSVDAPAKPVPQEHLKKISELRQKFKFIVGYAGGHGISNALHVLIAAAEQVQKEPIAFVLIGQGPEKEILQKKVIDLGMENIYFLPAVPKVCVASFLSLMDCLYLGWNKSPLYKYGISPNKIFDYMLAQKPIIHSISAGNDIVKDSKCGISVPAEKPKAVANAVLQMLNKSYEERGRMGRAGKNYVQAKHDLKKLSRTFLDEI